jgi:histidyl-tRNA synthetase
VELIGADSISADVELITLSLEVLKKLGLKNIELKLSHAGLIRALLTGFGLSPQEQGKVFDQILDGDIAVLSRLKAKTPDLARLLTPLLGLKGESPGFLRNLKTMFGSNLPEFIPALDNFIGMVDLLTAMGRGFEYYTGIIFQISAGETKLGGGGRYNALIPLMGGENTPASGFALQMNTLMNLIEVPSPAKSENNAALVMVIGNKPDLMKSAYSLTNSLREAGFMVSIQVDNEDKNDFEWIIEINAPAADFVIASRSNKRKLTATTIGNVVNILEGKSGS